MTYTMDIILTVFPIVSCFLLLAGKITRYKNLVTVALWLSMIAIIFHYQTSGGEILGSYFNYTHALIYSLSILVLLLCLIDVLLGYAKGTERKAIRYMISFFIAASIISVLLLLANLWINARFIENKKPGTPVLQVATFKKLDYCNYNYVFYKVGNDGKVSYLCPNYYGLLPAVGSLEAAPDYLLRQLPPPLKTRFQPVQTDKT